MKKLIIASALLLTATFAQADIAAPPTEPATQATGNAKEARKEMHAKHKEMKEKFKAESAEMKEKIKAACSEDVAKTGCSAEFGDGLMKCLHEYKTKNADFKVSESCMAAAHGGREMRHERKMARKAWKDKKQGGGEAAPAQPETK